MYKVFEQVDGKLFSPLARGKNRTEFSLTGKTVAKQGFTKPFVCFTDIFDAFYFANVLKEMFPHRHFVVHYVVATVDDEWFIDQDLSKWFDPDKHVFASAITIW